MSNLSLTEVTEEQQEGKRRRSNRAAEKRRKRRRRRTWVSVLLALVMICAGVFGAWLGIKPLIAAFNAPNDFPGPGTGSVTVKIDDGMTGTAIGTMLRKAGVVKSADAFVSALAADPAGPAVHPGTYSLRLQMSGAGALAALLDKKNLLTISVTIPEGKRLDQTLDLLSTALKIKRADLQKAVSSPALGLPAEAKGSAEGLLFPARYDFPPDVTALKVVQTMLARTTQAFEDLGVPVGKRWAVLTEASLVQAEAGPHADYPKIARVFANRIARKMPLALDTTIHFITKHFTVQTTTKDTQKASPYNTYLHAGLPPGPIVAPGEEAINAVLHPAAGTWLYFVTVNPDTGETAFATTDAERQSALAQYNAWQKANPGK